MDERRNSVILLGATAGSPETEYGWIEPEAAAGTPGFAPVRRFWEKPSLNTATELQAQGCLWNTFVMIGSASSFLEMIRLAAPVLFQTFHTALPSGELDAEEPKMQFVYDCLDPSDFSREVLALSTERLLVASCGEVGWSDLGEPRRFIAALTENGSGNPWAVAALCNKCGLTREQIVTLSNHGKAAVSLNEPEIVASSS